MAQKRYKVRVREGCSHRVAVPKVEWDPDNVGHMVYEGEEIVIDQDELDAFGDKFEVIAETKAALTARPEPESIEE